MNLEEHIRRLVEIEPSVTKVISCFVQLEHPRGNFEPELEAQFHRLRVTISQSYRLRFGVSFEQRLRDKLISTLTNNPKSGVNPILLEAVQLFVKAENAEGHDRVRKLRREVHTCGLGVSGYAEYWRRS